MKIVVNTTTFPKSETDPVPRFVLEQIKELSALDQKLDIHVLIPHNAYGPVLPDHQSCDTHAEVRYHYFPIRGFEKLTGRGILPALKENPLRFGLVPFLIVGQYLALRRLCKEVGPDLVYAHWFMTPAIVGYFVCKAQKIPLIFTTHASDVSVLRKVPFAKHLIKRVLNYADRYTAVSRRTAQKLSSFFSQDEWNRDHQDKLSIIPMGTSFEPDDLNTSEQETTLCMAGVAPDKNLVLCMGRLAEKKGFKYLIEAYAKLNADIRAQSQLVIAGSGQLETDLKNRARTLLRDDEYVFTGHVDGDLKSALFERAFLVALPSIIDSQGDSEGLPVVLLESLAKGRIVIATNVSGAEEVLTNQEGFIIDQKSPARLAESMEAVFAMSADEKEAMETAARTLSKSFSWQTIAQQHLDILKRVA